MKSLSEQDLKDKTKILGEQVKKYQDYPTKGVLFYDIFSLLMEPKLRNDILSVAFTDITKTFGGKFDTIVGIEARGLIIGLSVANILNVRFVPIRRVGKLPGKCIQIEYTKESGKDVLEVQDHSINKDSKILVVADLLATGCTIKAAEDLISKLGGKVVGMYVVLKSKSSDSEKKLGYPVIFSLSI